ncbi:uncharacterized protein BP01DRAFT_353198 [Aspergillus saccharolyticus JOP 1030-1]|uniref:Uncharacterized protein n=1 Tax=Aspergillus saccharolyticus JOP 1030-1 TaxID=1450539 RepID=A0A318ZQI3_9EURO|nr:hypothetical protein BP01DRAFT_353198 [Aspergillus saccharolyticus JOP 1030-1]PYH48895.1 hypothetical protein BP01DRAFT_353198 [Aspergillus saccharolyticus JOP 1030-1]
MQALLLSGSFFNDGLGALLRNDGVSKSNPSHGSLYGGRKPRNPQSGEKSSNCIESVGRKASTMHVPGLRSTDH